MEALADIGGLLAGAQAAGADAIRSGSLIGLAFAFLFGLLSFASPCVLPMAAPYLAYLGGTTLDQVTGAKDQIDRAARRRIVLSAVFFVLGLGTVFVMLGIGMATAGNVFLDNKHWLSMVSGVLIFVFGVHFWGLRAALPVTIGSLIGLIVFWMLLDQPLLERTLMVWPGLVGIAAAGIALWLTGWEKIPLLNREARFEGPSSSGSVWASFLIGMAFAFGWTPCIGPILGVILTFASQSDSIAGGAVLLGFYAFGLGVPFLIGAFFIGPFLSWAHGFRRHLGTVERVMGATLILVGVIMVSGDFERMAFFLIEAFPALATIG